MAKRKQSKTQQRISNLLRQISRMEKRGYSFPTDIRETVKGLSPQKARFFTPEKLYERSVYAVMYDIDNYAPGEIIKGTEAKKLERRLRSIKAAETRKRKREKIIIHEEDIIDIEDDVISNFGELLNWLESSISDTGKTIKGEEVPKSTDLMNYSGSVKRYISRLFNEEIQKDKGALAERIYNVSDKIDELIGVIEYAMYKESVRVAGNQLIAIIRGTATLSREDRLASEAIANATDSYEEV